MNPHYRLLSAAALVALAASSSIAAAPLDALLTANHAPTAGAGEVEVGYDVLTDSMHSSTSTSSVGDYKGEHVRGGVAITPRLWLDGTYWKRNIDYRSFDARIDTWQVAGQFKLLDADGRVPALAIRFGGYGNSADSLSKSANTTVAGTKFTSATIVKPRDTQLQLDVIGTWATSQNTAVSLFGGAGASRVKFDSVSATSRTANGCEYNVAFSPVGIEASLATPCTAKVVITRFSQPASETVDVYKEAQYKSRFVQVGANGEWHSGNWRARLGYQFQAMSRDDVDDIIEKRGGKSYKHNHVLVTDVSYNVYKNLVLFARGQVMSNQFNGEIPMAYNSLTADKYNQKYGFLSVGASVIF
jgi:hypothetical protein